MWMRNIIAARHGVKANLPNPMWFLFPPFLFFPLPLPSCFPCWMSILWHIQPAFAGIVSLFSTPHLGTFYIHLLLIIICNVGKFPPYADLSNWSIAPLMMDRSLYIHAIIHLDMSCDVEKSWVSKWETNPIQQKPRLFDSHPLMTSQIGPMHPLLMECFLYMHASIHLGMSFDVEKSTVNKLGNQPNLAKAGTLQFTPYLGGSSCNLPIWWFSDFSSCR